MELYHKYRPTKFSELVGQDSVVKMLNDLGRRRAIPHCLLLTGPSGTGKTSTARILRKKLGCGDADFVEVNAAETRGIDLVRDIKGKMGLAPISGKCRVWLVDESARLTVDAQSAFLKILEDTPSHVYFMLATTDPQKLKRTIITRSTEVRMQPLDADFMRSLLLDICVLELEEGNPPSGEMLDDDVIEKIVDVSDGSPRKALVLLNEVIGVDDVDTQLSLVEGGRADAEAFEIAQILMKPGGTWREVVKVLNSIEGLDESAESIRWMVLSYAKKVLLGNSKMAGRAYDVIEAFRDNWFDCKSAGLVAGCFTVLSSGRKQ